jgi:hypothetical protein
MHCYRIAGRALTAVTRSHAELTCNKNNNNVVHTGLAATATLSMWLFYNKMGTTTPTPRCCAGSLRFTVDGEDRSGSTVTATQATINELLSPSLPQVIFQSQSSVASLLEASDKKFKERLGPLLDLSVWQVR